MGLTNHFYYTGNVKIALRSDIAWMAFFGARPRRRGHFFKRYQSLWIAMDGPWVRGILDYYRKNPLANGTNEQNTENFEKE